MGIVVYFEVSSCVASLCSLGLGDRCLLPKNSILSHALCRVIDDLPSNISEKVTVDASSVLPNCTQIPQVIKDLRKMGILNDTVAGRELMLAEKDAQTLAPELGFIDHYHAEVVADKFCSTLLAHANQS